MYLQIVKVIVHHFRSRYLSPACWEMLWFPFREWWPSGKETPPPLLPGNSVFEGVLSFLWFEVVPDYSTHYDSVNAKPRLSQQLARAHNSSFFSFTQHCRSTCSYFDVFIRDMPMHSTLRQAISLSCHPQTQLVCFDGFLGCCYPLPSLSGGLRCHCAKH